MAVQKQAVVALVQTHKGQGRTVGEVLGSVGVARSSYYRWKKSEGAKKGERQSMYELTAEERDRRGQSETPAVPPSAYPGDVTAKGNLSFGLGDLWASKRAGADRAL